MKKVQKNVSSVSTNKQKQLKTGDDTLLNNTAGDDNSVEKDVSSKSNQEGTIEKNYGNVEKSADKGELAQAKE